VRSSRSRGAGSRHGDDLPGESDACRRRSILTRSIFGSAGALSDARRARQSRAGPSGFQEVAGRPGTLAG